MPKGSRAAVVLQQSGSTQIIPTTMFAARPVLQQVNVFINRLLRLTGDQKVSRSAKIVGETRQLLESPQREQLIEGFREKPFK